MDKKPKIEAIKEYIETCYLLNNRKNQCRLLRRRNRYIFH